MIDLKFPDKNPEQRTRTPADLSPGYYLKSGSRRLDAGPRNFLRSHGLNVANRVRFWDVAMNRKVGNIVQSWSDPRASVLFITAESEATARDPAPLATDSLLPAVFRNGLLAVKFKLVRNAIKDQIPAVLLPYSYEVAVARTQRQCGT